MPKLHYFLLIKERNIVRLLLEEYKMKMEDEDVSISGKHARSCKYGENAWQAPAGFFTCGTNDPLALDRFVLVEGEAPSYNNWCDVDRLLQVLTHIAAAYEVNNLPVPFIAIGAKHGNSCGAAVGQSHTSALRKMITGDPLALFGGLVTTNFPIDIEEAECLRRWGMDVEKKRLLDSIVAPSFSEEARRELNRKGGKCRMLENPALKFLGLKSLDYAIRFRYVRGGFLRQPNYTFVLDLQDSELEYLGSSIPPQLPLQKEILLAWAIGSTSNSNTITLVKEGRLIGNGVGQQDRVGAANLAIARAQRSGHSPQGAVAYSDSFFPFPDGVEVLIDAGVRVIAASKGSVNDNLIREACKARGVTLYLIPDAKGRGFFGH